MYWKKIVKKRFLIELGPPVDGVNWDRHRKERHTECDFVFGWAQGKRRIFEGSLSTCHASLLSLSPAPDSKRFLLNNRKREYGKPVLLAAVVINRDGKIKNGKITMRLLDLHTCSCFSTYFFLFKRLGKKVKLLLCCFFLYFSGN